MWARVFYVTHTHKHTHTHTINRGKRNARKHVHKYHRREVVLFFSRSNQNTTRLWLRSHSTIQKQAFFRFAEMYTKKGQNVFKKEHRRHSYTFNSPHSCKHTYMHAYKYRDGSGQPWRQWCSHLPLGNRTTPCCLSTLPICYREFHCVNVVWVCVCVCACDFAASQHDNPLLLIRISNNEICILSWMRNPCFWNLLFLLWQSFGSQKQGTCGWNSSCILQQDTCEIPHLWNFCISLCLCFLCANDQWTFLWNCCCILHRNTCEIPRVCICVYVYVCMYDVFKYTYGAWRGHAHILTHTHTHIYIHTNIHAHHKQVLQETRDCIDKVGFHTLVMCMQELDEGQCGTAEADDVSVSL